ncbi:GNAT family N-acetyltransferase [Thalassotalea sediminis]|uniref:GNAT family N-acetyltransferase n=1 Tax=Thalassotalea sediminis TaxID=1759089 RepID=UPI002574303A|nr:GNAT family protein [Thalassotalea sediminis]
MITLRPFKKSDIDELVSYLNDPQVTQYITDAIPKPYKAEDANEWVTYAQSSQLTLAIEYHGGFVGCISAERGAFEYLSSAELGYWIARKYWRLGIATIAIKDFSDYIFRTTDINRLHVSVVTENIASSRVLEKNGFKFEGKRRQVSQKNNQFYDEDIWALLRSEYQQNTMHQK